MNPELPIHESANLMNPELPIREPARIGPLQMLSSIFGVNVARMIVLPRRGTASSSRSAHVTGTTPSLTTRTSALPWPTSA